MHILIWPVALACAQPLSLFPDPALPPSDPADAPVAEQRVVSVYDGDTFTLASGDKVRLQWVNTPERRPEEPYAMEAQRFAERFLSDGPVELVPSTSNPRDKYGRVLAGARTPQGDLAEALLREGLAHVFVIPPAPDHLDRLLEVEASARAQRLGIWSTDAFQAPFHMTSFHANAPGPDDENVNGERLRLANVSGTPQDLAGYELVDLSGDTRRLPRLVVPAGHTVVVHAGRGVGNATPSRQLTVHLGSDVPIWSNERESVTLLDPSGRRVDERHHRGRRR